MNEWVPIISLLANVLMTVALYTLKSHSDRAREEVRIAQQITSDLQERLRHVEIHYVHKSDLKEIKDEIINWFDKRFDQLKVQMKI